MESNFQTSFIPKKPMIAERTVSARPVGLLTLISIFLFFSVIIASLGLYFYDGFLKKNIVAMENDLNLAKDRFEPSKIIELQVLDKRLIASSEILSKHIAISPIFKALQDITMKTVSYTKFSYDFNQSKNSRVEIKMSGVAVGYKSIALQSDLFTENKYFIDPVFSNLSLDDKGNVIFDLDFSVDPNLIDYEKLIKTSEENQTDALQNNEEIIN